MKILLCAANATYNHTNLALRYIREYLLKDRSFSNVFEVAFYEFTVNDDPEEVVRSLYDHGAQIYAFSCYIWNITFIKKIVPDLKKILPESKIILGGPEVSYSDTDFPYADHIIRGPGEKTFKDLAIKLNSPAKINIARIIEGERAALSELPFPYTEDERLDQNKQYYYQSCLGCPYSCSYCLSSAQKYMNTLDVERTKKELSYFIRKGVRIVKLVDRTFNFDETRAMCIWKFLVDEYKKSEFYTQFHFEICADILSDEALEFLSTVPKGIFRFECGIQSTDPETLKRVCRRSDLSKAMKNICVISAGGRIELHVDLIAGLPGEDSSSIKRSFSEVYNMRPDMIQLGFLKILSGSILEKEVDKYGIVYSDDPPYTVLRTDTLSYTEMVMIKRIARITDRFYNSDLYKYTLDHLVDSFFSDDAFTLFAKLAHEYFDKGGFTRTFSRKSDIFFLSSFLDKEFSHLDAGRLCVLKDLLKFDYYRYDSKGYFPELGMNMSAWHDLLPESIRYDFTGYIKSIEKKVKPRTELFTFDVSVLLKDGTVEGDPSFVLYDLSGDKPRILRIAQLNTA